MRVFGKTWAITWESHPTYLHSLLQLAQCNGCVIRVSVSWLWPSTTSRSFPLSISLTTILKFCCPFRILISSIASRFTGCQFFLMLFTHVVKYTFYFIIFYLLFTTHLLYICRHYSTVDILFCSVLYVGGIDKNSNASVVLFTPLTKLPWSMSPFG